MSHDLLLSSGFLAFGRHAGFLAAIEDLDLPVGAVVGTSSGALVGALWAAGSSPDTIVAAVSAQRPVAWLRPHLAPWRGLSTVDGLVATPRDHLPATFEALPRPLGVGVVTLDGRHRLVTSGPLPEAVAASCAVPGLFVPVDLDGEQLRDGAVADRLGYHAWRAWRPGARAILHVVDRTHGVDQPLPTAVAMVRTPPSGARLWGLGPIAAQAAEARRLTHAALADHVGADKPGGSG